MRLKVNWKMSFKFNFNIASDSEISEPENLKSNDKIANESVENLSKSCDFLSLTNKNLQNSYENISLLKFGDLEVQYVIIDSLQLKTDDEVFSQINSFKTDLIPGKYEGGLKIWECALDLATYIIENDCIKSEYAVLELGCGAGLPGLVAYLKGASVTFQDFNPEVLEYSTLPNVILNTDKDKIPRIPDLCSFLNGDWGDIQKKFYSDTKSSKKFDIILTSETIYSKMNQKKLLELMKSSLKPDGIIYLAAKIHYFGVGGGIIDFENLINSDKTFEIVSVHRISEGVERQILVIKFRMGKQKCSSGNVHLSSPVPNLAKDLSKIPKSVNLSSNLFIEQLSESHSKELFSLTDSNRTYLREWLPWLDSCNDENATLNFICSRKNAVSSNSGLTFGIFYNKKVAGTISFNQIHWSSGEADIGYWIGEEFQGLGLVTLTCSKLIEIGFEELDLKKICISCAVENNKSQRIPTNLGFKKSEVVPKKECLYGTYVDHVIYTISRDEWTNKKKGN